MKVKATESLTCRNSQVGRRVHAILVIQNGKTKLVNIKQQDSVTKILDMVPDLVDKFTHKNDDMISDEEAKEVAFPDGEVVE